ncbi:MAG TPA: bifunctional methylenetetrahydrofolate dehydrogenase/methenyltetrahydrofolate cyclohydrolase, partial [Candidatus Megaira endosymbiont of Hartmannula sinica]|nr:bifunctional methylenetetrahydrofolate dehydrogenase/methenyltetrahydrofolate cyclohydrolase [Candidatus Megaera endosymbiont of Hartmannula sinica]
VGKPLLSLLNMMDATCFLLHKSTLDKSEITQLSDIVIVATGNDRYFGKEYFNKNTIVIDVGINSYINEFGKKKISGDVDFINVKDNVRYITPVPGGVGPLTVSYLMSNTIRAFEINSLYNN